MAAGTNTTDYGPAVRDGYMRATYTDLYICALHSPGRLLSNKIFLNKTKADRFWADLQYCNRPVFDRFSGTPEIDPTETRRRVNAWFWRERERARSKIAELARRFAIPVTIAK
jgi:hypothetical protein